MGRSLAPIASAPAVGGDRSDGSITFQAGSSQFTIERRGGREVHREPRRDRLDPFLRFARMFVVQCLLHQNDLPRAEEEFATLTGLNPARRESLGRWFAQQRRNAGI